MSFEREVKINSALASVTMAAINGGFFHLGNPGKPLTSKSYLDLTIFNLLIWNGIMGAIYWTCIDEESEFSQIIIKLTELGYGLQDMLLVHLYSAAIWIHAGLGQLSMVFAAIHITIGCCLLSTTVTGKLDKIPGLNVNNMNIGFGFLAIVLAIKLTRNGFASFAPLGIMGCFYLRHPIKFYTGDVSVTTLMALSYPYSINMPNFAGLVAYCVFSVLAVQAFAPIVRLRY